MRIVVSFFDVKQKAAYAMRMSDSSSDVCSSDLVKPLPVCDLVGLAFGLRVADCGVGQRHLGASLLWGPRSEERRVGKECGSTCRYRWSQYHKKKKHETTCRSV